MMTTMCICNRTLYSHNQCDNDGQGWCRNKIENIIEHQVQVETTEGQREILKNIRNKVLNSNNKKSEDTVWHTDEQGNIYHIPIKEEDNGTGE